MRARPCLPPCHLGPAQLIPSATSAQPNLYELANRNHNMAYSGQQEGPRLYRTTLMYGKLPKGLRAVPLPADSFEVTLLTTS